MREFVIKNGKKLRTGVTTGTCAAAAAKAAVTLLLTGEQLQAVTILSKMSDELAVNISSVITENGAVSCSVIKDSGDDPDITNGAEITATVTKISSGIIIDGGVGVGRVTKPGLKIAVGNAAINPTPLQMISREVNAVCLANNYSGGIKVIISVKDGEGLAKKTMNPHLGITGGISILGTTGIVEPMSEKAVIDTIKTELDMRVAEGGKIIITPGNYGLDFAETELGLNMDKAVKCSNFIGETLDYAEFLGINEILLIGHAGKLVKLAGGIMNTYSKIADCRMEIISAHAAMCGAEAADIKELMSCVTVDAAIKKLKEINISERVFASLGEKINFHLNERTKGAVSVKFIVFTSEYGVLVKNI